MQESLTLDLKEGCLGMGKRRVNPRKPIPLFVSFGLAGLAE